MKEANQIYFIKEGKIFLAPVLGREARPLGDLIEDESSTVAYFENKFLKLEEEVDHLQKLIQENDNKGSFLMKVIHLRKILPDYNGIGDFEALEEKLKGIEAELQKGIAINRAKNLEIKRALIFELKEIINTKNWGNTLESVKTLQQNWIKTGRVPEENEEEINSQYQDLIDEYFEHRKAYINDKQELKELRIQEYKGLIEEATALKKLPPEKRIGKIKQLKTAWKEVGNVPKPVYEELLTSFKEVLGTLKPKKEQGKKALSKEEIQKTLAKKEAIIDTLKSLRSSSVQETEKGIASAKKEWKETGFLPKEEHQKTKIAFGRELDFLKELIFIKQLADKRVNDIASMDQKDLFKQYIRLTKNLINRDKETLASYKENTEKITILDSSSEFNKSMQLRMESIENKLEAKKLIISYLTKKIQNFQTNTEL